MCVKVLSIDSVGTCCPSSSPLPPEHTRSLEQHVGVPSTLLSPSCVALATNGGMLRQCSATPLVLGVLTPLSSYLFIEALLFHLEPECLTHLMKMLLVQEVGCVCEFKVAGVG